MIYKITAKRNTETKTVWTRKLCLDLELKLLKKAGWTHSTGLIYGNYNKFMKNRQKLKKRRAGG